MWGFIIAIISGALMSIQGVFNTGVTKQSGIWMTAGFVQLTALLVCVFAWLVSGREGTVTALFEIDRKYMLLGGVIGAFITYTVIKGVEFLGPAKANMFIITAQLMTAYLIELLGIFGVQKAEFDAQRLFGIALMMVGIVLFQWR